MKKLSLRDEEPINDSRLNSFWRVCLLVCTVAGILLAISQLFLIKPIIENSYMYWMMAFFMSFVFIIYPATSKSSKQKVPFYDIVFFVITITCSSFFALNGFDIMNLGWAFSAPMAPTIMSILFWVLILESVRRAGGATLFFFTAIFSVYPLFASVMPSIFQASSMEFLQVARFHAFSTESIIGIPMQVVANTILGYIIFGVVLVAVGGGQFFLDFAAALLGAKPGGPAKVAVLSSACFGTLSGSVISNIITTGSVTIPTMKKCGYPPYYAAAVEACASTGGCILPPVMGTAAFVMASFLGVPYVEVAKAAAFPAVLYFFAIYMQVHFFAQKTQLRGMDKTDIPKLLPTLKKGIIYIIPVLILVYFLYLRRESQAPFVASLALIVFGMLTKETRLNLKAFGVLILDTGKTISSLVAILAACGFIIGAFSLTGVGTSLSRELVQLAGGNVILMLIFGAVGSFILGMGMTITACYIFLAVILIPALMAAYPFDIMAVHLFVLYFGVVSYITPPVALGSYTAAGIAGANPIKTGLQSMRLGIVSYIVPFFFVACPAILFRDSPMNIAYYCTKAALGVMLLSGGIEGYFFKLRNLSPIFRITFILVGFLIALPFLIPNLIGLGIAVIFLIAFGLTKGFDSGVKKVAEENVAIED